MSITECCFHRCSGIGGDARRSTRGSSSRKHVASGARNNRDIDFFGFRLLPVSVDDRRANRNREVVCTSKEGTPVDS